MLSANILPAAREIHFSLGSPPLGVHPVRVRAVAKKTNQLSAVLPALESCLPEFASRETLFWTEQICSKLYSQSQYDLFTKLNTGVWVGFLGFFLTAEINKSKLCEVILLCLSKLLQLQSQSTLLCSVPLCCVQRASTGPAPRGERKVCCVGRSVAMKRAAAELPFSPSIKGRAVWDLWKLEVRVTGSGAPAWMAVCYAVHKGPCRFILRCCPD